MRTGLLWTTFRRDLEWFEYSARSYKKFVGSGRWDRAMCFVPSHDRAAFEPVCAENGIELVTGKEWLGKGFLWHMVWKCQADMLLDDCEAIWHIDSDCAFICPSGPENWMHDGKIIQSYYTFDYRFKVAKTETHPGIWKERVDRAIGGDTKLSVMTGHPHAFYRETYAKVREAVSDKHLQGWENYVLEQQNVFPQGFCEFETLGAVAHQFFFDRYAWRNLEDYPHPSRGHVAEGWSHGGLDRVHDDYEKQGLTKQSARDLYKTLEL